MRLLRERGWRAVGVDWSTDALATARRASPVPLATMGLTALALRTGAIAAYVSLGVVEHDPAGPDAILAEAHRVLAPGGTLVISVPYVNGVRRLGPGWIRRQNRTVAAAGGKFYQYAFTRAELLAALGRHGFTPLAVHPYDPARILRKLRPGARRPAATSAAGEMARRRWAARGGTPWLAVAALSPVSCDVRSTLSRLCACSVICCSSWPVAVEVRAKQRRQM